MEDQLRYREYSTTDIAYALSKYPCTLTIKCPDGTIDPYYPEDNHSGKTIKVFLQTRGSFMYYNIPEGYYAYIIGCSHFSTFQIPTDVGNIIVSSGKSLSQPHTEALAKLATLAIVMHGADPNDSLLQCNVGDFDMRSVVSHLVKLGKVKVRYTEHEFRDDERELTWIEGYPLDFKLSVEGLSPTSKEGQYLINMVI